jgi:hypothetical protein
MPSLKSLWEISPFVGSILSTIFPAFLAIAVFVVIYGILKFIIHADDESERAKGRWALLWGIVGIFLMLSVWGLVWILVNTFGLSDNTPVVPVGSVVPQYGG